MKKKRIDYLAVKSKAIFLHASDYFIQSSEREENN